MYKGSAAHMGKEGSTKMATYKVSPAHEKLIKAFSKHRGLSTTEGLAGILNIAASRLKALANYDKKKSRKPAKKTARKAARKAATKSTRSTRKAQTKPAARKTRKASASKKSTGVPKGFPKSNSAPAPEATAAT